VTIVNPYDAGTQSINHPEDGNSYDAGNITVNATLENNYYNKGLMVPANCSIYGFSIALTEDFEGAFQPIGWTVVDNGGTGVWVRNDITGRPNYAGGSGFCAVADCDFYGSPGMDTELRTPIFAIPPGAGAELSYISSYNYLGTEYAVVDISIDGGSNWIELLNWTSDHDAYGPGEPVAIDLSGYAGNANCMIRWHYVSVGWDWWWEIDDVAITILTPVYTNEQNISVPALGTEYVEFTPPWNAAPGDYLVIVQTKLAGDINPGNDVQTATVTINPLDAEPPEITGVTVLHSIPKDTSIGWENFTATVTDDSEVNAVQLNITYPDASSHTFAMTKNGDTYYYNTSLTLPGGENTPGYDYHIYATDTFGRQNASTPQLFKLPMNPDVNEDGSVGFVDIMGVAGLWGASGPNGWHRADVNNDGSIGFVDIMGVAGVWGATWLYKN
jgi:hypothetical protein